MPLPRTLFRADAPADHDLSVVRGAWPAGLSGEMVISAPHPDTFDAPHPFFGDGMVYRLSLSPGLHGAPADGFAWRQRRIDSPSARLRAARPDVFRPTMVGWHSPFGMTNAANTAPLPWGDRLFTTWDVGRPVEIDARSLQYLGEVGHRNEWQTFEMFPQPLLPMVPSTAHPIIDPERDLMWTVNTVWGQLHVVAWNGEGPLRSWPITDAILPQSVHTITQTRDWLVVGDCAYKVEPQVLSGGERTQPANHDAPLYLIRKDVLLATPPGRPVSAECFRIAPEINHYYATYDDSAGVQVLFEHTENADIAMTQRLGDTDGWGRPCDPRLKGMYGFPMSPDRTSMVIFEPGSGRVTHRAELRDPSLMWSRQLSAMDWSTEGRTAPTAHHLVHHGFRPEAITELMLKVYDGRFDRSEWPAEETAPLVVSVSMPDLRITSVHAFAMDDLPTSPIFVPRGHGAGTGRSRHAGTAPGGHDGWVVVPVVNDAGFRVEAFDAADVGRGPIATLAAPGMHVPFVLHSAWMPRAVASAGHDHHRFGDELARVDELPADLAAVAHRVAAELDAGVPMG